MIQSTEVYHEAPGPMLFDLEARESVWFALQSGCELFDRLSGIDLRTFEPLGADTAVRLMLNGSAEQLMALSGQAARLLASLPGLVGGADVRAPESGDVDEWEFDLADSSVPAVEGLAQPAHDKFCEEIDAALTILTAAGQSAVKLEDLTAICAMLAAKLRHARNRLKDARRARSKWGMITEGEEIRRKSQRALFVGLSLATRMALPDKMLLLDNRAEGELEQALMVRELLLEFRADSLGEDNTSNSAVSELSLSMRATRIRLLKLFGDERYRHVRASDRYQLRQLHGRISAWLEGVWDDDQEARRILFDCTTFADLLLGVNHREILCDYDTRAKNEAQEALHDLLSRLEITAHLAWLTYAEILWNCRPLSYRDESILAYIEHELANPTGLPMLLRQRVEQSIERLARISCK